MSLEGTVNKYTWGKGRYIGEPEADDIQDAIEDALQNIHLRLTGYGVLSHPVVVASGPADLEIHISAMSAITLSGHFCRWTTTQDIDVSQATAGSNLGATTVVGGGKRRFIVVGVKVLAVDQEPGVDYDGNAYNYKQDAQCEFEVYMSAELPAAEDWQISANFTAILTEMRLDDCEPIALVQRTTGDVSVADSQIFDCSRWLFEDSGHRSEHLDVRRQGGYGHFPLVMSDNGKIHYTTAGDTVILTGGEKVWLGWDSNRNLYTTGAGAQKQTQMRLVEVPNVSIALPDATDLYMIRMYLDGETGVATAYYTKRTLAYPRDADIGLHAHGSSGGANGAFPPTLLDIALLTCATDGGGNVILDAAIANTASSWVTQRVHADQVLFDDTVSASLSSTNVQDVVDELADEKLARDGSQVMQGTLDMDGNDIDQCGDVFMDGVSTVDGRDLSQDGIGLDNHVYPLKMVHRAMTDEFHPSHDPAGNDCQWNGFRLWGTGGLREGIAAGGAAGIANATWAIKAAINSGSDPALFNLAGAMADTDHIVARLTVAGGLVSRYMDLASWGSQRIVLGMDMHLTNVAGAASLEVTPGFFIKEGRVVPLPATETLTLTPAGLASKRDTNWAFSTGWHWVYATPLGVYNAQGGQGSPVAGHNPSAYIFVSQEPPDYSGGHPTWPFTQFLGAIRCIAAGVGVEEWKPMTKRGNFVVKESSAQTGKKPDVGDSPLTVTLSTEVPRTAKEAFISVRAIETTGIAGANVSFGPETSAAVNAGFPWQYALVASERAHWSNIRMPLARGVESPTIYLFSDVAGDGDVTVDVYIHGYWEDPLRPYHYEP